MKCGRALPAGNEFSNAACSASRLRRGVNPLDQGLAMIAYLEGTLLSLDTDSCVILTPGGVGYEVFLSARSRAALSSAGENVRLFAYTLVREDALTIFGFPSWEERRTFGILLGVPKLGPKTALALLGVFSPQELAACVAREDAHGLARTPGIGLKSAKRLVLDLKDKLSGQASLSAPVVMPASAQTDTLSALLSLGYARQEAEDAVKRVFDEEPDLDAGSAIRQALKHFASK